MGYWPLPNVHTLSDASYGLKPIKEKSRGIEILRKENIRFPKGGLMGVTFRHMYWKWGADEWSKYSTMVARICDDVFERKGLSILFIPHNTYEKDTKYMDDRPGHSEIVAKMKHKNVAHQIKSRLSVDDTLALFPLLDITFSNRRHTAMFAALHDVVGMGVGEINHVKPPMEQLGINPDKFVSEEDFDYKLMRDNLFSIWDDKAIIKLRIKDKLPALRQKALDNSKFALNLLQ